MKRRAYLTAAAGFTTVGYLDGEDTEDDSGDENEFDDTDDGVDEEGDGTSELVGTFDDFEDLDAWGAFIGSIAEDTDHYYDGSQSARLSPSEDDGQVRVRRELDEPVDVREVVPGLAMTTTVPGRILIQLHDSSGDYIEYSQQVLSNMPLVRHNFGLTRIRGEPDLSDVRLIQVVRWFGEDVEGELWIDDLHFVPRPDTGTVMLQFHGGYETHYTEALSILEEYGHPATTFVATDRIRPDTQAEGDRLTVEQLDGLADAGWTIGSYSARGLRLTDVESDELESDIVESRSWLEEQGYGDGARFFAFPASQYDAESYRLVQENYDLAFAGRSPAQGYAGNPHLCSLVSSPDADDAVDLLDWTARLGGITSIAFYRLEDEETLTALEETVAHLDELVETGHLEVTTPEEMATNYVS